MKLWLRQLWALLRKHLLQKRRNRRQLAIEVLFPLLFVPLLLVLIRREPLPRDQCATVRRRPPAPRVSPHSKKTLFRSAPHRS